MFQSASVLLNQEGDVFNLEHMQFFLVAYSLLKESYNMCVEKLDTLVYLWD